MPHRVDAPVNGMEACDRHPMVDRLVAEAKTEELTSADHPMLGTRELRDRIISSVRTPFAPYIGVKCGCVGHGATVAPPSTRVARKT